jgi:hypothetical protein
MLPLVESTNIVVDVGGQEEEVLVLSEETVEPGLHNIMTWQLPEQQHLHCGICSQMPCGCVLWTRVCEGRGRGGMKTCR